jgi:predicted porin
MKSSSIATLSAMLVAGCLQAQETDVKAELAKQNARLAELEKKASAPFKFPAELTPYVLIDLTLSSKSNATADGRTKVDLSESFFSGSRWGLRGDIKTNIDGFNVIYKLESEYFLYDGEMGKSNVLFNRDAWVGIKSDIIGQITFGRQNTLARDFAVIYGDPFAHPEVNYDEGGWTNNNNFKSLVYYAGAVSLSPVTGVPAQTRMDKGAVWKKVAGNGFAIGAAYNLNYETNSSMKNTTLSAALGYNAVTYHLAGYYTQANNNGFTQTSTSVGGNVNLTPELRINAGIFSYTAQQGTVGGVAGAAANPDRKDTAWTISASYKATPKWTYFLGYQSMKADHAGQATPTGTNAAVWQNPFADGANKTFTYSGSRNTGYVGVFRHLSRRMEAYAIADVMKLTDTYKLSGTNKSDSQTELAIGIRLRAL